MSKPVQNLMYRSIEAKIRPPKVIVESRINRTLGLCRSLYNAALEEKRNSYEKFKKSPSFFDQCKSLTQIRHENEDYADLDTAMTRLSVLRRLDLAFKAFFSRCKRGETPGFPRFKGKDRFDTLVFGDSGWKLSNLSLQIKGIGKLSLVSCPKLDGKVLGLRLVRRQSGLYCQVLTCLGEAPPFTVPKNPVGIDVGLESFATLSDGSRVENPRFLRKSQEKLKQLQQALSTKQRGSNNRRKAKARLARASEHVHNQRKDFLHKVTRDLVSRYDGFFVEKLQIRLMLDKSRSVEGLSDKGGRGLRRSIQDAGWGLFSFFLGYKAAEAGKLKKDVNPKNTSSKCSRCGRIEKKTLETRQHSCPCGLAINRDHNAAINILDLGLKVSGLKTTEDLALRE